VPFGLPSLLQYGSQEESLIGMERIYSVESSSVRITVVISS